MRGRLRALFRGGSLPWCQACGGSLGRSGVRLDWASAPTRKSRVESPTKSAWGARGQAPLSSLTSDRPRLPPFQVSFFMFPHAPNLRARKSGPAFPFPSPAPCLDFLQIFFHVSTLAVPRLVVHADLRPPQARPPPSPPAPSLQDFVRTLSLRLLRRVPKLGARKGVSQKPCR